MSEHKQRRGLASMSPEKARAIQSKGGKTAHANGTAHQWSPDEARHQGRRARAIQLGREPEPFHDVFSRE